MTTVSGTSSTPTAPLTADELLAKSASQIGGDLNTGAGGLTSPADLLKRAQDRANGIIDPPIVQTISKPAASLTPPKPKVVSYTDQDWYIKAKVSQLKSQISIYSNLPGLDPSGAIMDSLTKQVNDLVIKQRAKLKEANDQAAAKQKELADAKASADQSTSASDLLSRVRGKTTAPALSDAVKKLLDGVKGVNTTA